MKIIIITSFTSSIRLNIDKFFYKVKINILAKESLNNGL